MKDICCLEILCNPVMMPKNKLDFISLALGSSLSGIVLKK
jgi:hypothetical protein